MQETWDRYASSTDMGAYPFKYVLPQFAPIPGPSQTSTPVETNHVMLTTGRDGTGKALRLSYSGAYQESNNVATIGLQGVQPDNQTVYVSYWARVTPASNWPQTTALAVKWIECWHVHSQNTRLQFNTRYPSPDNPNQTAKTVWQVIDQAETRTNGDQPIGPYFQDVADGQWHRFTHAVKSHASASQKDGFAKMWVDGVLVIDIEQATVGVVPAGGKSAWCAQADVNGLATADGISEVRFGGPQTTVTGAWTMDIGTMTWWRK